MMLFAMCASTMPTAASDEERPVDVRVAVHREQPTEPGGHERHRQHAGSRDPQPLRDGVEGALRRVGGGEDVQPLLGQALALPDDGVGHGGEAIPASSPGPRPPTSSSTGRRPQYRRRVTPEDALRAWGAYDLDDPFPLFAALRERGPVHEVTLADGHAAWVVLDYEQARAALNDPRLSKNMQAALLGWRRRRRGAPRPGARPPHARGRPARPHPPAPARVGRVHAPAHRGAAPARRGRSSTGCSTTSRRAAPTDRSTSWRRSRSRCRSPSSASCSASSRTDRDRLGRWAHRAARRRPRRPRRTGTRQGRVRHRGRRARERSWRPSGATRRRPRERTGRGQRRRRRARRGTSCCRRSSNSSSPVTTRRRVSSATASSRCFRHPDQLAALRADPDAAAGARSRSCCASTRRPRTRRSGSRRKPSSSAA